MCNNDEPEHILDQGEYCWCEPIVEELENGDLLIIHRSKDESS